MGSPASAPTLVAAVGESEGPGVAPGQERAGLERNQQPLRTNTGFSKGVSAG